MAVAGEDAELHDRRCSEQRIRDTTEFFENYPQEAAIVLQRSVELSALLSSVLVAHCALLVWASEAPGSATDSDEDIDADAVLRGLCLLRVACVAPRPYWWLRERMRLAEVRNLPTPQQVARRLSEIQSCPRSVIEEMFRTLYYAWLICAVVLVSLARLTPEPSMLTQQVWHHLIFNFLGMAVHRITCMLLFFRLTQSSTLQRGVSEGALDAHTMKLQFTTDDSCTAQLGEFGREDDCSICLCGYSAGQELRKLSCGHCFHRNCLDPWLLNHRNRCPLCMDIVGLQEE